MDYLILDQLWTASEERTQEYQAKTNTFFTSSIEEVEEPFTGSNDSIRLYLFKNYVSSTGLMNLAVVIRETNTNKKSDGGLAINNVECAIYPLYDLQQNAFDLPPKEELPELHPDTIKFIIAKRSLPKKPQGDEFDPTKHKWSVNDIAKELHISNRLISQYCRVKNI